MDAALSESCKPASNMTPAQPWRLGIRTEDLDQVSEVEAAAQWDTRLCRYERGPLGARVRLVQTDAFQIVENTFESGVMVRGGIPKGTIVFGLVSAREQRYQGRPVDSGDVVIVQAADEIEYWCKGRSRLLTVAFEASDVARAVEARWGVPLEILAKTPRLRLDAGCRVGTLQNTLAPLLSTPANGPAAPRPQVPRHESLLDLLSRCIQPPAASCEPTPSRLRVAGAAADYLEAHAHEPLSMTALCRELGARERTLYLGFQERFGLSPHAYLIMLRMDAARKALTSAPPGTRVTDIVFGFGIGRLGRFSMEYRRRFGESPSATLSRSARQAPSA